MLGNNHLSIVFPEVITIKTLFASAKPSIIADCRGEIGWLNCYNTHIAQYLMKLRKFGQVIEETSEIFFFKNHDENDPGKLVPDLFLFFKKALYELKASSSQLNFNIF